MLEKIEKEYKRMQKKYGDSNLDSITFGGCKTNPDICFVFMNPTGRNITASKEWKGQKAPWIGTKNVWNLFYEIGAIDTEIYEEIRNKKGKDWTVEFADEVYNNVEKHKVYITNLAKCTQSDARALKDEVFLEYLDLFFKEINIVKPKKIVLFGNQVSSIVLNQKISVSTVRKQEFNYKGFLFYSVYYPVGNGFFNIDKAIEDIKYIMSK
ncbi:MAG: hypothetical protein HFE81_02790 [Bacilli bacterium]|nr:hypothetical protein [Bacilli bacterium]